MIACGKSSDIMQIIHVSDVVINEENIEITLRCLKKTDQLGKISQVIVLSMSRKAHFPVSLTNRFFKSCKMFNAHFLSF